MSAEKPVVLILGDSDDFAEEARELLRDSGTRIGRCIDVEKIVAAFDEANPEILIFAFLNVVGAERAYLDLYRGVADIQCRQHSSILVCRAQDARTAFELCKRRLFDDYVIIRPQYDPQRLLITVMQIRSKRDHYDQSFDLARKMKHFHNTINALSELVQQSLSDSATVAGGLGKSGERLQQQIAHRLRKLSEECRAAAMDPDQSSRLGEGISDRLDQFANGELAEQVRDALSAPQKALGELVQKTSAKYAAQAAAVEEVNDWAANQVRRVLLLDDDPFYMEVLKRMLSSAGGFEIHTASGPVEALATAERIRPHVMLIDFEMPEMSGLEFISSVRASERLKSVPVILLTGHSERSLVKQAIESGVSGFIVKPGTRDEIVARIRQVS